MAERRFFPAVLFGLMTVLIVVLSSSFILSLVLSFSSLTETSVNWLIITMAFIAMFLGGTMAGVKAKGKGWIAGACTALLFTLFTFIIQYLGYDHTFTTEQYLFHGGYILISTLGGVIGVNLSSHSN